mgnify:CR=1 FL=1
MDLSSRCHHRLQCVREKRLAVTSDDDTWALKNCSIDILDQSNTTAGTASSSLAAIPNNCLDVLALVG